MSSSLFHPTKIAKLQLAHRVVLAPLTRMRADKNHVPSELAVQYYAQRSSTPGTLLISEGTGISHAASGYPNIPGLWNDAQVAAWKPITKVVHENGSFIFAQLAATGRASLPAILQSEGPFDLVSSGDIPMEERPVPRPLTLEEIGAYKQDFASAAKNAIAAGFDGVEIHGANGYLIEQFLKEVANNRTDSYGGSAENRARFVIEVVDAVVDAIGEARTALRLSPWNTAQDLHEKDPIPAYTYVVEQLVAKHPSLAYLHLVESRPPTETSGSLPVEVDSFGRPNTSSNAFIRSLWLPRPYITAGGYSEPAGVDMAVSAAEQGALVAFGKHFIANPDLPLKLKDGKPLNEADPKTFYLIGSPVGYIDYPFAEETKA